MHMRHAGGRSRGILSIVAAGVLAMALVPLAAAGVSPERIPQSVDLSSDVPTPQVEDLAPKEDLDGGTGSSGPVTVEIAHGAGPDHAAINTEVRRLHGTVLGTSPGITLIRILPGALPALNKIPGVDHVRTPVRVDLIPVVQGMEALPTASTDVHVTLTNASAWHDAGYRGQGVKVGIVDGFDGGVWSALQSSGYLPAPAGTYCRFEGATCNLWAGASVHGVAVAEIIHDMAPDARLYLATAVTVTDLSAAIAWFDSQGVQVISRSLGSHLDGPGDGTGSVDAVVDDAISRGMVWLNAVGNHASASGTSNGGYWRGSFVDADADGWMEFAPGDEHLGFYCGSIAGFRWSDWQASGRTDYDIAITDAYGAVLASSFDDQAVGAPPIELPGSIDCVTYPIVYLWVQLYSPGSGTAGDILEFMANKSRFEYSSNPYSATGPAGDSANAGLLAIGAIDPAGGGVIAPYSSQGPTNDGRVKPDLSAPSCLPTVSYQNCFNGTSAATPVAAGVAALVWGAGVATTAQGVAGYLRSNVIDRGAPGPDNVYGAGQLLLASPPVSQSISLADNYGLQDPTTGIWRLRNSVGAVTQFYFGNPGDIPFMGDWDCDGIDTPGLYRQSDGYVYLRNSNSQGVADIKFFFGNPGDVPVAGDFDNDGCDSLSIYRPSEQRFYIINRLGSNDTGLGAADYFFLFGNPGDKPVAGDWDGDGIDEIGLHRESSGFFYYRNTLTTGVADGQFYFGDPGDRFVAGDWGLVDNRDTPAVFRPSNLTLYFRHSLTEGVADSQFTWTGSTSSWNPVAGAFGLG